MKEILILGSTAGLLFVLFLIILIAGIVKRSKRLAIISIVILLFSIGVSGWTAYRAVTKSYNKVTALLEPRTGEEIYTALFGKPQAECVEVLHHQDQTIPKIDIAIRLHFKTCPDELERILQLRDFQYEKLSAKSWDFEPLTSNPEWFRPASLGDSILVFKYDKDQFGNGQTIYASTDSTEAYCLDVWD